MVDLQTRYDEAMFDFSQGNYQAAIDRLKAILEEAPDYFEARMALGMAYYRLGDYSTAIAEGHKAEKLRPKEQLVHTNLSLFYMKSGDKKTAEHHGLQARIASWRETAGPGNLPAGGSLPGAPAPPATGPGVAAPAVFPDMPWKKKAAGKPPPSQGTP